jgi:hypothetical protein
LTTTPADRDDFARSLGRIEFHDPASWDYPVPRLADVAPTVTLHDVTWPHYGDGTNQRNIGACTAATATDLLMTRPLWRRRLGVFDDEFMFRLYDLITKRDPFAGEWTYDRIIDLFRVLGHGQDTGSSWKGMFAALRERGLVDRVEWAFSGDHGREAMLRGPLALGIPWRSRMFDPEPDGRIRYTGDVVGGHEIGVLRMRVAQRRMVIRNHWINRDGTPWGIGGLAYLSWDDYDAALEDGGDQSQFIRTPAWRPPAIG